MELIKLDNNLKLNIPEIDSQHEALIRLVNRLHETMLLGADRATLGGILSQLLTDTRTHFSTEERLMSQFGYPEYAVHKSQHDKLMQHLERLAEDFHNGELLLSFAIVLDLKGWAMVHIEKFDKPMGAFLKKRNGVETEPG
jgi:hemerythrin